MKTQNVWVWAAAAAVWAAAGPVARGAFVQFTVPANADVVAESSAAAPSGIDGSGRALMSQTEAAVRAAAGGFGGQGNGLPDDGQFTGGGGTVQLLPFGGNNVARRTDGTAINITVTADRYNSLTLFATSGAAAGGTVNVTLNYANGPVTVTNVPVPDWFSDAGDAGFPAGVGFLVNGLDRTGTGGTGFENSNDPAVFAIPVSPVDPARVLNSISIVRNGTGGDVLNVFAVTGDTVPEPTSPGLLGLGALGLLARRGRRA